MKKLIYYLFIIPVLLLSCNKNNNTNAPEPEKKIEGVFFGTELPVQLINVPFYVGVRYVKRYSGTDEVTMTFDGKSGERLEFKPTSNGGDFYLFKFSGVDHLVDGKIKLTIKNGQQTYQEETPYKIVPDFELKTIWNSLNKSYISAIKFQLIRWDGGGFAFNGSAGLYDVNKPNEYRFGPYGNLPGTERWALRPLIKDLRGLYHFEYTDENLTKLTVILGDTNGDQEAVTRGHQDMEAVFGSHIAVTQEGIYTIRHYNNANFKATCSTGGRDVIAVITKK